MSHASSANLLAPAWCRERIQQGPDGIAVEPAGERTAQSRRRSSAALASDLGNDLETRPVFPSGAKVQGVCSTPGALGPEASREQPLGEPVHKAAFASLPGGASRSVLRTSRPVLLAAPLLPQLHSLAQPGSLPSGKSSVKNCCWLCTGQGGEARSPAAVTGW